LSLQCALLHGFCSFYCQSLFCHHLLDPIPQLSEQLTSKNTVMKQS
jgi:hypothetical protein